MEGYSFEIITGPMSCGKTEELLRRIRRCIIAKRKVKVISPDVDTRSKGDYIESRNGLWLDAIKVKHSVQILSLVKDAEVVGTGLELDFKAEPFGSMPELMCIATQVDKLHAVCMKCGCEHATRTQRLIDGKPADKNSPLIMIGGDETYEARCIKCYELPNAHPELNKGFRLLQFDHR